MSAKFILLFCLSAFYLRFDSNDTIVWGNKQLEWSDFKGIPDAYQSSQAVSACALQLEIAEYQKEKNSVTVTALFQKKKSWVKNATATLLDHEQGHFDIAEIYARKLRKQLKVKKYHYAGYDDEIIRTFNSNNIEMDKFHDLYDRETDYSRNQKKQNEWKIKITSLLEESKSFQNREVIIIVNN